MLHVYIGYFIGFPVYWLIAYHTITINHSSTVLQMIFKNILNKDPKTITMAWLESGNISILFHINKLKSSKLVAL